MLEYLEGDSHTSEITPEAKRTKDAGALARVHPSPGALDVFASMERGTGNVNALTGCEMLSEHISVGIISEPRCVSSNAAAPRSSWDAECGKLGQNSSW